MYLSEVVFFHILSKPGSKDRALLLLLLQKDATLGASPEVAGSIPFTNSAYSGLQKVFFTSHLADERSSTSRLAAGESRRKDFEELGPRPSRRGPVSKARALGGVFCFFFFFLELFNYIFLRLSLDFVVKNRLFYGFDLFF